MNVVQRWPRRRANPEGLYWATVRGETRYPSLANSPQIMSSPQVALSRHMRRMRLRRSMSTRGRPRRRHDLHRQSSRQPARCHRTTVSGRTTRTTVSRSRNRPARGANNHRSKSRRRGRLTCLRSTTTCWRNRRFSATSTVRGATNASTRCRRNCRRVVMVPPALPWASPGEGDGGGPHHLSPDDIIAAVSGGATFRKSLGPSRFRSSRIVTQTWCQQILCSRP